MLDPEITVIDATADDVSTDDRQLFARELAQAYLDNAGPVMEKLGDIAATREADIKEELDGDDPSTKRYAVRIGKEIAALGFITIGGKTKDGRIIYELGTDVTKTQYRQRRFNELLTHVRLNFIRQTYPQNPIIVQTNNPIVIKVYEKKEDWNKIGAKERCEFWDHESGESSDEEIVEKIEQTWKNEGYVIFYFDPLKKAIA